MTSKATDDIWPGMPRTRHAQLGDYLHDLADSLGLRDWTIRLGDRLDEDENAVASALITENQRDATVMLGPTFTGKTAEDQRSTLIHELLHCHLDAGFQFATDSVKAPLGMAAWCVFETGVRQHIERIADDIAVAIAGRFPLPPAPSA